MCRQCRHREPLHQYVPHPPPGNLVLIYGLPPVELRRHWTQPGLIAAAMVWTMLILLAVLGMVFLAFKLDQKMPGLYFMLVLQMSALGLMSSPALAALWSRRRTHARNTDRRNRGNSIY